MTLSSETTAPDIQAADGRILFEANSLLPSLCGAGDEHLARIEQALGVTLLARGNVVTIHGAAGAVDRARRVLAGLYNRLRQGQSVEPGDVDAGVRLALAGAEGGSEGSAETIRTRKRSIAARSRMQAQYLRAMRDHDLVFALGPAGTGKTYLAVAAAVEMMMSQRISRIILSRPAVEAGERLGFLPGDMKEKVDPYLRPLYDALHDMLPGDQVMRRLTGGEIEVAPLAFMRGRTLANAFVILDEAQNTTAVQMKMFLTRLGEGSRMVVTGDPTQVDLPRGVESGLADALETLDGVEGVGVIRFTDADVVRHPLVARIVRAYDRRAALRGGDRG